MGSDPQVERYRSEARQVIPGRMVLVGVDHLAAEKIVIAEEAFGADADEGVQEVLVADLELAQHPFVRDLGSVERGIDGTSGAEAEARRRAGADDVGALAVGEL